MSSPVQSECNRAGAGTHAASNRNDAWMIKRQTERQL